MSFPIWRLRHVTRPLIKRSTGKNVSSTTSLIVQPPNRPSVAPLSGWKPNQPVAQSQSVTQKHTEDPTLYTAVQHFWCNKTALWDTLYSIKRCCHAFNVSLNTECSSHWTQPFRTSSRVCTDLKQKHFKSNPADAILSFFVCKNMDLILCCAAASKSTQG